MEVKIIDTLNGFLELKTEWEELQEKAIGISYYSTFDYLYHSYNINFTASTTKLSIICVYKKNKIIAIAPFIRVQKKIPFFKFTTLKFIGNADFSTILIDNEIDEQEVLKKVFDVVLKLKNIDLIELTHIEHTSALAHFCFKSELYANDFYLITKNPYLSVEQYDDILDYKKKYFKGKFSYYTNKLKKECNSYLEVIEGNQELLSIAEIHKMRNAKNRISLFENKKTFELISTLYKDKNSTLSFILRASSGEIICYATCYYFKNILHNWNTAFNPIYKNYSPGEIIYFEMIKYAIENNSYIKKIDFGAGGYPWKFRMTDTFVATYSLNKINKNSKKKYLLSIYNKLSNLYKVMFLNYQTICN